MTSPNPLHVSYLGQILLRYGNSIFFGWLKKTRSWSRAIEFISCWLWSTEVSLIQSTVQYRYRRYPKAQFSSPTCILVTSRLNKLVSGSDQQQVVDTEPWAIPFCNQEWAFPRTKPVIYSNQIFSSDLFICMNLITLSRRKIIFTGRLLCVEK